MRRRAILRIALLSPLLLTPTRAMAEEDPALMKAANAAAMAFMKALRKKDVETALHYVDAPFLAEDAQLLATRDDVKAYLTTLLGGIEASELPNAVLAILDYDQSRAVTESKVLKPRDAVMDKGDLLVATGRDGISRSVLLVKCGGGNPVVVGVGY